MLNVLDSRQRVIGKALMMTTRLRGSLSESLTQTTEDLRAARERLLMLEDELKRCVSFRKSWAPLRLTHLLACVIEGSYCWQDQGSLA